MNLKIELMRLISDYSEYPENFISKKIRKDFKNRARYVFEG